MFFEIPKIWIVILNVIAIPVIHLGISWIFTRMPLTWFQPDSFLFRERPRERNGKFYQRWFFIRSWKGLLPDAAPWFKGFSKKNLRSLDNEFLEIFRMETCRGEAAHIAQVFGILLTLLWTPGFAAVIIVVYSVLSNLPCILLQRFTRSRLKALKESIKIKSGEVQLIGRNIKE